MPIVERMSDGVRLLIEDEVLLKVIAEDASVKLSGLPGFRNAKERNIWIEETSQV